MKRFLFALIFALFLPTMVSSQSYYGLEIREPVVLAVPDSTTTTIATAVITNISRRPLTLVRVDTDAASLVYIHLTTRQGGVRSMHEIPSLQIGVGRSVAMDDNGYHIMLVRTKGPMIVGRVVRLNFVFMQDGRERVIPVDFPVVVYDPSGGFHAH